MNRNDNWNLDDVDELEIPTTKAPRGSDISPSNDAEPPNRRTSRPTTPRLSSSEGEPIRRTSRPSSSEGEPIRRTSRPSSSEGEPTRRTSRPSSSEGDPTRRTSRPSSSEGEPTRRTSRPSSSEGDPTRRTSRPSSSEGDPTRRTSRPSSSEGDPTRRTSRPSSSEGEPTRRTSRPSSSEGEPIRRTSRPTTPRQPPFDEADSISKEYLEDIKTDTISRNFNRGKSDDFLAEIRHDLDKIDSHEDVHYKKDDTKFKINVKDDIRRIPNYEPEYKGPSGVSIFAKIMFGIMIVAISIGISITIIFCGSNILGLGTPNADYVIEIDLDSDIEKVANTLANYGVIESALLFKTYVDITVGTGDKEPVVQFGTYLLNSSMSYDEMLSELCQYSSAVRDVSVMFKEGITIYQMSKLLEQNGVCNAESFIETIQNVDFGYDFLNNETDNKYLFHNKEGYMFPDTYIFYIGDDPVNVGKKMVQNYNNRVTALMEEALPTSNLNQHELMTIASIVQLEAPDLENMKKVASVYLNRINNPGEYSQLQADPTKEYANELKLQMEIIDQEIIDAYNTYAGIGLPPGPVCNPGLDAIIAVLEPADTNYFYFCTNLYTGEFYFADNLEDHNKNVYNAGLRQ